MLTNKNLKILMSHVTGIIGVGTFVGLFLGSIYQILKIINAPIMGKTETSNIELLQFFSISQTFNDVVIILVYCIILSFFFSIVSLGYIKIYNFCCTNINNIKFKRIINSIIIILPPILILFYLIYTSVHNGILILLSFYLFHLSFLLFRNTSFIKSDITENNYLNGLVLFVFYMLLITLSIGEDYTFNYLGKTQNGEIVKILYMNDKYVITENNGVYPVSEIANYGYKSEVKK